MTTHTETADSPEARGPVEVNVRRVSVPDLLSAINWLRRMHHALDLTQGERQGSDLALKAIEDWADLFGA